METSSGKFRFRIKSVIFLSNYMLSHEYSICRSFTRGMKKKTAMRDFHNHPGTISLNYSTFCCRKHDERRFAKFYDQFYVKVETLKIVANCHFIDHSGE